jgi:hypothetical protein
MAKSDGKSLPRVHSTYDRGRYRDSPAIGSLGDSEIVAKSAVHAPHTAAVAKHPNRNAPIDARRRVLAALGSHPTQGAVLALSGGSKATQTASTALSVGIQVRPGGRRERRWPANFRWPAIHRTRSGRDQIEPDSTSRTKRAVPALLMFRTLAIRSRAAISRPSSKRILLRTFSALSITVAS